MFAPAHTRKYYGFGWKGPDPVSTFSALADEPYSLFFDSARPSHPLSTYSYICWHPFETIESKNGRVTVTNSENRLSFKADPFAVLKDRINLWGADITLDPSLPAFKGGAAGMFGYDLARQTEKLPALATDDPAVPDMAVGLYDQVLAFNHSTGKTSLMILAPSGEKAKQKRDWLMEKIAAHKSRQPYMTEAKPLTWQDQCSEAAYRQDVRKIIDYIYAGDIFQANLSRRFTAELPPAFDAFVHYCHLREVNPAPFSGFMNFGHVKIASTSPERFIQARGRQVETRPIKGTLASTRPAGELISSAKDRAENVMIVDLLRNDLSKICEDHSINVPDLCALETYEGLHHLVSVVKGILRADQTPVDLLKACFPGGSITGAPKIRAMEIIEELEPQRRGPYCGSLGYIGFDGIMDTNILIRSLVYTGNKVHLQTGGGITAISDPQEELEETAVKAAKLFQSFKPVDTEQERSVA